MADGDLGLGMSGKKPETPVIPEDITSPTPPRSMLVGDGWIDIVGEVQRGEELLGELLSPALAAIARRQAANRPVVRPRTLEKTRTLPVALSVSGAAGFSFIRITSS